MKLRLPILFFVISLWLCSRLAFAGVEQISEKEFRRLAEELAPKVNLFAAGWEKDPKAEFYGGTTRDYLYWLKGQFLGAENRAQAEAVVKKLHALPIIDVRSFIIGDSDIDVISAGEHTLNAEDFGVRKIDFQKPDILDPTTDLGKNEILQGYIPAEKVRLGKGGFKPSSLGDGVSEIYTGKLSVHFASPEDFAQSKYAKDGVNHPILLALRYIRVQAINYFRTHGKQYPDAKLLHGGLDPESARQVAALVDRVVKSGELKPFLEKSKFKSWINGAIQKSFRSYTNPTAALELMKKFGVTELPAAYPQQIEPVNQYVFSQFREPKKTAAALRAHQVDESKFFISTKNFFPDGKLYHGTRTEEAFRGILFQGILPSDSGAAQGGLYGVAAPNKSFSEEWSGDKNRLLSFEVDPDAKIVNVTEGEGLRVWEATKNIHKGSYDEFAELFGIDIIRYPYSPQAFVVKNASVLNAAQGVYRKMMPVSELLEVVRRISDPEELLNLLMVNALSSRETALLLRASRVKMEDFAPILRTDNSYLLQQLLQIPEVLENPAIQKELEKTIAQNYLFQNAVIKSPSTSPAFYRWVDQLFTRPDVRNSESLGYYLLTPLKKATERSPNAIEFAMTSLKSGRMSEYSIDFLLARDLDQTDLDRMAGMLSPELKKPASIDLALAELLVKKGSHREKVRSYLMEQLGNEPLSMRLALGNYLGLKYFPGDEAFVDRTIEFTKKYFHVISRLPEEKEMPSMTIFVHFAQSLPDNDRLKGILMENLKLGKKEEILDAGRVLLRMNLQPRDLIGILAAARDHEELANILLFAYTHEEYARFHTNDPAFTRALLDISLEHPKATFVRLYLPKALILSGDPATMEKFYLEKFAQTNPNTDTRQVATVAQIIGATHQDKPISPAVAEAFLGYLERNPKIQLNDQALLALPLEEERVAIRIQNFLLSSKHHISGTSFDLLNRMPGLTEEFKTFIASVPRSNFTHREIEKFETLKAQKLGCSLSFAKLTN